VQDAREALALVRAQNRARRMLEKSMAAREIQTLEGSLEAAIAIKVPPTEALVVQARALLATLVAERDVRAYLRQAVIARDIAVIDEGLFRASQVCIMQAAARLTVCTEQQQQIATRTG